MCSYKTVTAGKNPDNSRVCIHTEEITAYISFFVDPSVSKLKANTMKTVEVMVVPNLASETQSIHYNTPHCFIYPPAQCDAKLVSCC